MSNSGSISTTGVRAHGIVSIGLDATITNSGSISTKGQGASGIRSTGSGATITNSGSISTTGFGHKGIQSSGFDAAITNSGSISTRQNSADGIWFNGSDATITNSGSISTKGRIASGILSIANENAKITNSGIISTTGVFADGIASRGFFEISNIGANITNSGSIITTGREAIGIESIGLDATIINSGSISTKGDDATGINQSGNNATITNNGSISTTGDDAIGINSRGNATITNSGSIGTKGDSSAGIWSFGRNTAITNSGLISATGSGSYAILGDDGNQTVNIQPGSRIVGPIDLSNAGDGDVANVYGSYGSAVLTFENTETINVFAPNAVRKGSSDTVAVIDPTGESVLGNTLNSFTTGIHNVINRRMQHTPATKPVQLASLELSAGMLYQERAPVLWGQVFGQNTDRDGEGQTLAYDHDYRGVIGGYERDYNGARAGFVAGAARAETDSVMLNQDTDSLFVGVYGHAYLGKVNLTASLLAGLEDHDTKRQVLDNVSGYEMAKSDKDSYFVSPSITLSSAYALDQEVEFRPSATLTYTVGRYDSYQETGTTNANLDVDSRTLDALGTRLQLEWAKIIEGGEINVRLGAQSRHTGGDDVAGNLGGANFKFVAMSDSDVAGAFAGWGIRQEIKDKLSVLADLEVGRLSGDEEYVIGQVMLEYRF